MLGALAAMLDPAALLRRAGVEPDPWQERVLRSRAARLLLCCSRQAGKSTVTAALALHAALRRKRALVLLLAPSLRQSREIHAKCAALLAANAPGLGSWGRARRRTRDELVLGHGSRVLALPGAEATLRGFSGPGLIALDEASRIPDALYAAARPMLAVGRGRLVALSTPFGRQGWFWREWAAGAGWERHEAPWTACPRISPEFIALERAALGDAWVEQEYGCSFGALTGLVYPGFASAFADAPPPDAGEPVGGIDFGRRNPFAAVWGFRTRDDVLWLTGERYLARTPLHEHARALPGKAIWRADPAGRTEIEELRAAGLRVWPGNNALAGGIAAVTARLESGRLRVARGACPELAREAGLYRYEAEGSETPLDRDNHALAALRYLVMGLDAGRMGKTRVV
ncbi:MAG: terminase large subunit domain-containing protein [Planctomycetota bacterium]